MSNQIRIGVIGSTCSGKSTVMAIIESALRQHGFDPSIFSVDDDHVKVLDTYEDRIKMLKDKDTVFKIHEVQLARNW